MPDLERLISDRQDQLRGRPRDWIDAFGEWRRRTDWAGVAILTGILAVMLALLAGVLVLM